MNAVPRSKKTYWGFFLVVMGLLVQLAAAFNWTPGTFVISAALAVPLVILGVAVLGLEALGASRAERPKRSQGEGS